MSNDKKIANELHDNELDDVTGGADASQLLGHELTHVQQKDGSSFIGETEKNLSLKEGRKRIGTRGKKIVAQTGGGEI